MDSNDCFSCPTCKTTHDTIIIDGLTLGTLKDIPKETSIKVDHVTCHVPIQNRVWITNIRMRDSLKSYVRDGISPQGLTTLAADLDIGHFLYYVINGNKTALIREVLSNAQIINTLSLS